MRTGVWFLLGLYLAANEADSPFIDTWQCKPWLVALRAKPRVSLNEGKIAIQTECLPSPCESLLIISYSFWCISLSRGLYFLPITFQDDSRGNG